MRFHGHLQASGNIRPIVSFLHISPLLAFGLSTTVVWVLTRRGIALDQPNHRSLHTRPIPRTGGLGVMAGVFAAWVALSQEQDLYGIAGAAAALMALSFYDDIKDLPAGLRLAIHILIVAAFFVFGFDDLPVTMLIIVVFAAVWMINLYNFMDGSDGLAGGMAVIGFGFYAFTLREQVPYGWASAAVAMASLGFLIFNFHPAKIFLGDSGSIPLGFLAAAFGYIGWTKNSWPWWYPVLVFSPFIVDASLTLAKRALRRERIWDAHRDHYYQRLIRMGWGHRKTALAEYGLMLTVGGLATLVLDKSAHMQTAFLMLATILYIGVALLIDFKWSRHAAENRNPE